jgi:hypothetical protein
MTIIYGNGPPHVPLPAEVDVVSKSLTTGAITATGAVALSGAVTVTGAFQSGAFMAGTTGGLALSVAEAAANITAAESISIAVNVPSGARIIGCQLRVDTALTAGETWDAAYAGGATAAIASGAAVAKSTKVNSFFDVNAATNITSDVTTIAITKNGGGSFTALGRIRAIVYYQSFTAMANAA